MPRFADRSLRARLLTQLVGLLAVVCLVVGVVTQFALRDHLIGQLDAQLAAAADRGARPVIPPPGGGPRPRPDDSVLLPGQQVGTLSALIRDGDVEGAVLQSPEHSESLTGEQNAVLVTVPVNGRPYTRDLGELGEYRLVATRNGSTGDVRFTGLPMAAVSETLLRLALIMGGVTLIGLMAVGGVGALTVTRTLRPLNRVARTASRVAELPLDRGEVALSERVSDVDTNPRTEVGKVGAAINRMLGHVANALAARQASESRVRQFVADASHELRTPLAAIRGYAELARRSKDEVPPVVAHAMSRVESEAVRMTTLVEDLLLLARLDSGREVVYGPVDLSRLVADAVADAHVAGRDHRWQLDAPAEPVVVTGDAGQVHQVLANLLANARTHTPSGTEVRTSLSTEDGVAVVTVVDNGQGIAPELLPEVFERFARGDNSRSRAAGSTGLGLAIVAAVVAAHNGTVDVGSAPGRTAFTVRLPLAPEPS